MKVDLYEDIINLPHPISRKHPQMSLYNRAAQFAPFAALTGYDEAIEEAQRLTQEKIELTEVAKEMVNQQLQSLQNHIAEKPEIICTYFVPDRKKEGGSYETVSGQVTKLDLYRECICMKDGREINLDAIYNISEAGDNPLLNIEEIWKNSCHNPV